MNKSAIKKSSVQAIYLIFCSFVLLYAVIGLYQIVVKQQQLQSLALYLKSKQQNTSFGSVGKDQSLPVRLKIPQINVDAAIENVGVAADGAMAVPNDIANVGWFNLGPRPGQNGSAVIAGHYNGKSGQAGVFANLSKLQIGDKLYVQNSSGRLITFMVRKSQMYDPGYADNVFSQSDGAHLNLITCDGVWDKVAKSYSKRLVVFADIVN
jgi:LPXTG-site transpeptidase (sortase) family protein